MEKIVIFQKKKKISISTIKLLIPRFLEPQRQTTVSFQRPLGPLYQYHALQTLYQNVERGSIVLGQRPHSRTKRQAATRKPHIAKVLLNPEGIQL